MKWSVFVVLLAGCSGQSTSVLTWNAPATDTDGNPIAHDVLRYNVYQKVANVAETAYTVAGNGCWRVTTVSPNGAESVLSEEACKGGADERQRQ